jgi:hypothetical protein
MTIMMLLLNRMPLALLCGYDILYIVYRCLRIVTERIRYDELMSFENLIL